MQPSSTPLVLDIRDGGNVVAIVNSGENADDVLRQAIAAAADRAGVLTVVQFTSDTSAVRRGLSKAILNRDVTWWSKEMTEVVASIEELENGTLDESVAFLRDAACIVMSIKTVCSARGMAVLRRRTADLINA
jgi:hypothetical protein